MIESASAVRSYDERVQDIEAFFRNRGAAAIFYGAEPVWRHAERTQALLQSWACADDVRLAGWLHSVYAALIPLTHEHRQRVADLAGRPAEEIVHLVATVRRAEIERRLGTPMRDASESVWKDCGLLCLASDIALLGVVPLAHRHLESIRHLATLCLPYLPAHGRDELTRLFRLDRVPSVDAWVRTVTESYDLMATSDRAASAADSDDMRVLDLLDRVLSPSARVLDLGCGDGHTVTRHLARRYSVFGLDLSSRQLLLADRVIGPSRLVRADLLNLPYRDDTFDAVCSYHAIVHLPRATHGQVAHQINRVLRPEGWALLCVGAHDLPGRKEVNVFGAPMWFSHYDADEYRRLLSEHGLSVRWSHVMAADTPASVLFVLAQRE